VTYGWADAWFHIRLVSCRFELDKTAGISGAAPEDCNRLFRGLLVPALRVPQQKLGMSGCISVDSGADSGTPGPSELHLGTMDAMAERDAAPSRRWGALSMDLLATAQLCPTALTSIAVGPQLTKYAERIAGGASESRVALSEHRTAVSRSARGGRQMHSQPWRQEPSQGLSVSAGEWTSR
jgi:hypothetical protein